MWRQVWEIWILSWQVVGEKGSLVQSILASLAIRGFEHPGNSVFACRNHKKQLTDKEFRPWSQDSWVGSQFRYLQLYDKRGVKMVELMRHGGAGMGRTWFIGDSFWSKVYWIWDELDQIYIFGELVYSCTPHRFCFLFHCIIWSRHSTFVACNKGSKRVYSSVPSSSSSISAQNPNTTTLFPLFPHLDYLTLRRVLHTIIITDGFLHFLLFTYYYVRTNVRKGTCVW